MVILDYMMNIGCIENDSIQETKFSCFFETYILSFNNIPYHTTPFYNSQVQRDPEKIKTANEDYTH